MVGYQNLLHVLLLVGAVDQSAATLSDWRC